MTVLTDEIQPGVMAIMTGPLQLEVESPELDMIDAGILDSLTLVQLLVELERTFEITVDLQTVELDSLRTVSSIARLVAEARIVA